MNALILPGGTAGTLHGIASAENLRDGEAAFLARWETPVLLVPPIAAVPADPLSESVEEDWADPSDTPPAFSTLAGRPSPLRSILETFRDALVVPLRKSDRNHFTQMITLGRASNNDIVIAIPTVSKLHGWFASVGSEWRYFEAGSTNGSWIGSRKLEDRASAPLEDGVEVCIGPHVRMLYKTPAGLWETVRLLATRSIARPDL